MVEKLEPGGDAAGLGESAPDCLLSSKGPDGAVTSVGPLSRDRAEILVQVYGRMYPDQTCWVQPLPREVEALHLGRVRRSRSTLPVVDTSYRDH
jgi:hypothetical protein